MTDQNDPWPLALGGNPVGARTSDDQRSARRRSASPISGDSYASADPFRSRDPVPVEDPSDPFPRQDPFPPAGGQAHGARRRHRNRGIPLQQPSDVATGPMALASQVSSVVEANPDAHSLTMQGTAQETPDNAPPASPQGAPRSRREALAAERAGLTGERPAVLPGPRARTNPPTPHVLHPVEAPSDGAQFDAASFSATTPMPVAPRALPARYDEQEQQFDRVDPSTSVVVEASPETAPNGVRTDSRPTDSRSADSRSADSTVRPDGQPRRRGRIGRFLLPLIALMLALSAVSTLLPGDNSLQVLLAAMAPLGALIAVPVIALAVHHHRPVTAIAAGLAAVLPWALVVGYATAGPQPAAAAVPLRIMLVNSNEGQVNAADVVNAVREHGVDLLVVNELTSVLAHDLTTAGIGGTLHARFISTTASASGEIGIWARPEVTDSAAVTETNMPAMTGQIQTAAGPIRLIAGHSPRPYPPVAPFVGDAQPWADDLRALAVAGSGDGPRVFVGDLNATPWNKQFRDLQATSGLVDAANVLGKGLRPTWPVWSPMPLSPVDHVMVGGGIGVRSIGTAVVGGSNHRALVVEIAVPPKRND